jgi:hypothetical protein
MRATRLRTLSSRVTYVAMARHVQQPSHSSRFEMRLTPEERRMWERAMKRDGFSALAEWVRVHMKKVVQST